MEKIELRSSKNGWFLHLKISATDVTKVSIGIIILVGILSLLKK